MMNFPGPLETTVSICTALGSTPTRAHEVTDEYICATYVTTMTGMKIDSRSTQLVEYQTLGSSADRTIGIKEFGVRHADTALMPM
jgi:hypothetical protein